MSTALPRSLGRFGRLEAQEDGQIRAVDTVVDREAELVRVPFGGDRREAREAYVAAMRERTTVVHPAIRAVLDAGEWEDDAFVALELLRGRRPIASLEDAPARARAASEILAGAELLGQRDLRPGAEVVVDDYGQPKILGLERIEPGEGSLVERAAEALGDDPRAERLRTGTDAERAAIRAELERETAPRTASFASDVAGGDAAIARAAGSRQMLIGLAVLAFFAIAVAGLLSFLR